MKRSIIAIILAVGLAWPAWAQPSDTAVGSWEGTLDHETDDALNHPRRHAERGKSYL